MNFFGLDLTSSEMRPSAYAVLTEGLELVAWGCLPSNADILAWVDRFHASLVAIDAPLSLPKGMCCLDESCPCRAENKFRICERELARLGIPCFVTNKKSIIKKMVCRGIALRRQLEQSGCRVIEIYPYASKVRLWGKPIPKKNRPPGLKFLRDHLAALIPSLKPEVGAFSHDPCDAVLAAYTAFLVHAGRADAVGDPDEGLIYIPSPKRPPTLRDIQ